MSDPRWLEILKASGGQSFAVAAACAFFLIAARLQWFPPPADWMIHAAWFGLVLCGFLSLASAVTAAYKIFPLHKWFIHYVRIRREQRLVENYIPNMTAQERQIIGYLLVHNQKMFTGQDDGGYAITLISRRIVVRALQPGQVFHMDDMPYAIPDHIWDVLKKHQASFPHSPPKRGEVEAHPWQIPWQVR